MKLNIFTKQHIRFWWSRQFNNYQSTRHCSPCMQWGEASAGFKHEIKDVFWVRKCMNEVHTVTSVFIIKGLQHCPHSTRVLSLCQQHNVGSYPFPFISPHLPYVIFLCNSSKFSDDLQGKQHAKQPEYWNFHVWRCTQSPMFVKVKDKIIQCKVRVNVKMLVLPFI